MPATTSEGLRPPPTQSRPQSRRNRGAVAIVKQVEAARGPELWEAYLRDVQDARATTIKLIQEGSAIAWSNPIMATVVTAGFLGILFMMLARPISLDPIQVTVLNQLDRKLERPRKLPS